MRRRLRKYAAHVGDGLLGGDVLDCGPSGPAGRGTVLRKIVDQNTVLRGDASRISSDGEDLWIRLPDANPAGVDDDGRHLVEVDHRPPVGLPFDDIVAQDADTGALLHQVNGKLPHVGVRAVAREPLTSELRLGQSRIDIGVFPVDVVVLLGHPCPLVEQGQLDGRKRG